MTTSEHVLLIILSGALAVLLVLAIAATILLIRLINALRHVARAAEHVVDSAEAVGDVLRKTAAPVGAFRFVKAVVDLATKSKQGQKNKEKHKT